MARYLLILCILPAFPGYAAAGLIQYDESIDGDLRGNDPLKQLSLDVGSNTVAGTIGLNIPNVGNDFDSFAFIVPDDTQLTGFSVTLDERLRRSTWRITEDGSYGGTIVEDDFEVFGGGATFVSTAVPLGPGTYSVDHRGMSGGIPGPAPYLFTLTVESTSTVPEPSSLVLLGIGGLSLLGCRWRRRPDICGMSLQAYSSSRDLSTGPAG